MKGESTLSNEIEAAVVAETERLKARYAATCVITSFLPEVAGTNVVPLRARRQVVQITVDPEEKPAA